MLQLQLSALFLMDLTPDDISYSYKEDEEESRVEESSLTVFTLRESHPQESRANPPPCGPADIIST